jgi:hypothetical protein
VGHATGRAQACPVRGHEVSVRINIITLVSRPANLPALADNLRATWPDGQWYCVFDSKRLPAIPPNRGWCWSGMAAGDLAGGGLRNVALEQIDAGWVYLLDDDNLIHPELPAALAEAVREQPDKRAFIFNQVRADGSQRLRTGQPVHGAIDAGQFVLDRELIGLTRMRVGAYDSDYHFVAEVYARAPERFAFIARDVTYYNRLR